MGRGDRMDREGELRVSPLSCVRVERYLSMVAMQPATSLRTA